MAQSKVIKHELEDLVVQLRASGRTSQQMADQCNAALKARKPPVKDTLTSRAIDRYLAALDKASVAPAHQPQVAEANLNIAIDFGGRLKRLDQLLGKWLDEAENAVVPMRGVLWDPYAQEPITTRAMQEERERRAGYDDEENEQMLAQVVDVFIPDWNARTAVAREMRGLLKNYVDLMARIHDAAEVQAFQEATVEAIKEASPEVAGAVVAKLRERQSVQRAAMLGIST